MVQNSHSTNRAEALRRILDRVVDQYWPEATLYVVATPIGNLADLSLRAWKTLKLMDVIAAEDTRASRHLLDAWEVSTPLLAAHRHNEAQAAAQIIERLQQGQRVALISDAGTPGVSDPGGRIVREVHQAGYQVMPIPGPSAPIAALMASGATSDENPAFVFAGFLPPKQQARQKWLEQWKSISAPVLMFETPHRLKASVADLLKVYGAERTISVARELTKRFEEIATLTIAELPAWLNENPHRSQGEFVLVLHEAKQETVETDALLQTLLPELLSQLSVRDAVRIATKVSGLPRSRVYQAALQHEASKK